MHLTCKNMSSFGISPTSVIFLPVEISFCLRNGVLLGLVSFEWDFASEIVYMKESLVLWFESQISTPTPDSFPHLWVPSLCYFEGCGACRKWGMVDGIRPLGMGLWELYPPATGLFCLLPHQSHSYSQSWSLSTLLLLVMMGWTPSETKN